MPQATLRTIIFQVLSIPALMGVVAGFVLLATFCVDVVTGTPWTGLHEAGAVYGFALVCTFLALWLVLGAVYAYLNVGQAKKLEVIAGFYSPATIADYFEQFWSGRAGIRALVQNHRTAAAANAAAANAANAAAAHAAAAALETRFQALVREDFGLRVFLIPVILLIAAGGVVLFFGFSGGIGLAVALSNGGVSSVHPLGINLDLISVAAIFGAYTWVASDVIVRNHQWTLHPSDLAWYALRLIIAIPLGHALAMLVGSADVTAGAAGSTSLPAGAGAFVAFVASMFSLDAITRALGKAATRFGVQMTTSSAERDDLIVRLAGVDEDKARALSVEGVSTIAQLVAVDPIRASIRSGLPFEYVLRLIDAALLWVFVGDTLNEMRPLGLRGASDMLDLHDDWNGAGAAAALIALQAASAAVGPARQGFAQAQAAVATAQAADPATVAAAQQAAAAAQAALDAANSAQLLALNQFLTQSRSDDRAAMMTALTIKPADKGPGLTAVGFCTIMDRLCADPYARFIRRLLV